MTIGIYKLKFKGTDKVYIGQSNNIERRYSAHILSMHKNLSPNKLQEAFNMFGIPELEILIDVPIEELNATEIEAIHIFNSVVDGFNTLAGGASTSVLCGQHASNAYYSNEVYIEILKALASNMPIKEIVEVLQVSESIIKSIRTCENHKWLKLQCPEEYTIVEERHLNYSHKNNNTAKSRGITYPLLINLKTKETINVFSLRDTARQLGMHSSNLDHLLHGKIHSCKGYATSDTIQYIKIKKVLDPFNQLHEIPYLGASAFAKSNNLNEAKLSELLNRKIKSHKGWTIPNE